MLLLEKKHCDFLLTKHFALISLENIRPDVSFAIIYAIVFQVMSYRDRFVNFVYA